MNEDAAALPRQWRYGVHPGAVGMKIVALGRVELPIGEALRLEMASADPGVDDLVHVQLYVATDAGEWALWLSCARADLADLEAAMYEMTRPVAEGP